MLHVQHKSRKTNSTINLLISRFCRATVQPKPILLTLKHNWRYSTLLFSVVRIDPALLACVSRPSNERPRFHVQRDCCHPHIICARVGRNALFLALTFITTCHTACAHQPQSTKPPLLSHFSPLHHIPMSAARSTETKWTRADVEALVMPYVRRNPDFTVYEFVKTVLVAVVLLPIRLIFFVLCGLILYVLAFLAMLGVPRSRRADFVLEPLHPVRNLLIMGMYPVIRAIAFVSFGIVYIDRTRAPPSNNKAFVVVSNHLGYIDAMILACHYRCSFVAKGAFERLPLIGTMAPALQTLFVREGQSLTTALVERVQKTHQCHITKIDCPGCPGCLNKLVIFPEGTTTNGHAMVAFRTGVFNAAVPVQPVVVQFPHRRWNMSWETIRFRTHIFRTMTQFINKVSITELPVYVPSDEEKMDPRLYARNVQRLMSKQLQQPVYRLNRKHKILYHKFVLGKIDAEGVREQAKAITAEDPQLQYLAENDKLDLV